MAGPRQVKAAADESQEEMKGLTLKEVGVS